MTAFGSWFSSKETVKFPANVHTGDRTQHQITHVGTIPISVYSSTISALGDVLYVPIITKNLISVG